MYRQDERFKTERNNFSPVKNEVFYSPTNNKNTLKRLLVIYLSDNNQMFISQKSAYSLGINNLKNVMIDEQENMCQITFEQLDKLKNKNIEFAFEKLNDEQIKIRKEKIQVYSDGIINYITMTDAILLELITLNNSYDVFEDFYPVDNITLSFLANEFDIEYIEMNNHKKSR